MKRKKTIEATLPDGETVRVNTSRDYEWLVAVQTQQDGPWRAWAWSSYCHLAQKRSITAAQLGYHAVATIEISTGRAEYR